MSLPLAGEAEEIFAGIGAAARSTNDLDDLVEVVEGDLVAFENVFALAGLAEEEGSAATNDVDAMIDEVADGLVEGEFLAAGR